MCGPYVAAVRHRGSEVDIDGLWSLTVVTGWLKATLQLFTMPHV